MKFPGRRLLFLVAIVIAVHVAVHLLKTSFHFPPGKFQLGSHIISNGRTETSETSLASGKKVSSVQSEIRAGPKAATTAYSHQTDKKSTNAEENFSQPAEKQAPTSQVGRKAATSKHFCVPKNIPVITKIPVANKTNAINETSQRIITIVYPLGRLGNRIFIYASAIGVALSRGLSPQLFGKGCFSLTDAFDRTLPCNNSISRVAGNLEKFANKRAAVYDSRVEKLSNDSSLKPIAITGYMQSWRYFHHHRDKIIEHLIFKKQVKAQADNFIAKELVSVAIKRNLTAVNKTEYILVGIHVRRTDMVFESSHKQGYMEAPKEYIWKAMDKMEELLSKETKPIVFVVASDDIGWCYEHVDRTNRSVIFSPEFSEAADLALLASCDHVIITSGTYGWWGAYLAGGKTIYYSRYPRPKTYVGLLTSVTDYYPPEWIPVPSLHTNSSDIP